MSATLSGGLLRGGGKPVDQRETEVRTRRLTDLLVLQTNALQRRAQRRDGGGLCRAMYSRTLAGLLNARFTVAGEVAPDLRSDLIEPGAQYPAWARFSEASPGPGGNAREGVFGLAVRLFYDPADPRAYVQDLLAATSPVAHASDPEDYLRALAIVGGRHRRLGEARLGLPRTLFGGLGVRNGLAIRRRLRQARHCIDSLATETYWSQVPFALGEQRLPVKYRFAPLGERAPASQRPPGEELAARLLRGPVVFELQVQRFRDAASTPVEDATVEWATAFETVGRLTLEANDDARASAAALEKAAFTPWNHTRDFVPIGPLNWARRVAYKASSNLRNARVPMAEQGVLAPQAARADG